MLFAVMVSLCAHLCCGYIRTACFIFVCRLAAKEISPQITNRIAWAVMFNKYNQIDEYLTNVKYA